MHPRCRHRMIEIHVETYSNDFSSLAAQVKIATSQNSILNFFEKKLNFGFPCCSTLEDLSIDVPITNVGLILEKLR